jgi:hypothetical protein
LAKLFNRLFGVLLHKVFHIEVQNRVMELHFGWECRSGHFADFRVRLQRQYLQFDELLEFRVVGLSETIYSAEDHLFRGLHKVENICKYLLQSNLIDFREQVEEDRLNVL